MPRETLIKELCLEFDSVERRSNFDWPAINVSAHQLVELCKKLKNEHTFDMLMDITAVDWGKERPRFTVVYHFLSRERKHYLRVLCNCENDDEPAVPSIVHLWGGANWHEREVYDMFGIKFKGHPDLKRILMWDEYTYYPLRKEFPLAGIETSLPAADVSEETHAKVIAAPMMGGPFCSKPGPYMSETEPEGKDESWTEKEPKPETEISE